jgi:hypothetical protein
MVPVPPGLALRLPVPPGLALRLAVQLGLVLQQVVPPGLVLQPVVQAFRRRVPALMGPVSPPLGQGPVPVEQASPPMVRAQVLLGQGSQPMAQASVLLEERALPRQVLPQAAESPPSSSQGPHQKMRLPAAAVGCRSSSAGRR